MRLQRASSGCGLVQLWALCHLGGGAPLCSACCRQEYPYSCNECSNHTGTVCQPEYCIRKGGCEGCGCEVPWRLPSGPSCGDVPWVFSEVFGTIFLVAGSALPTAVFLAVCRISKELSLLKTSGVTVEGIVIGKRQYDNRGKNTRTTHYLVTVSYPTNDSGTEKYSKEFAVDGSMYSTLQLGRSRVEVVCMPDDPALAVLKVAMDSSSRTCDWSDCFKWLFMGVFFTIFNGIFLFVFPWCYTPYWGYPLGVLLGCKADCVSFNDQDGYVDPSSGGGGRGGAGGGQRSLARTADQSSLADELVKLRDLHEDGALDDDEFKAAKAALLGAE